MSLSSQSSCEAFGVEDMFFSRTDKRGVIESSNTVFQRVSGYDWSELIGAPHKLVRDPDMPKAVFHLLWQTIQQGDAICAYICNRTKSGETYWVFATMFPLEDGYLSVRIKPVAGMLERVVPIYNHVAALEQEGKATPAESAAVLQEQIQALGFDGYREFMAYALVAELRARMQMLGKSADPVLEALSETLESTAALESCANKVKVSFRDTHQIPYNMRLQAGRIEGSDGPISVISGNHRQMSEGLERIVEAFGRASRQNTHALCTASLEIAMAQVFADMRSVFAGETGDAQPQKAEILEVLDGFSARYRSQSYQTLKVAAEGMHSFRKQSRQMRRALSGLELTRIMCKIERAKIGGDNSGLDEIVNRLALAQSSLEGSCDDIERLSLQILNLSESLLRGQTRTAA